MKCTGEIRVWWLLIVTGIKTGNLSTIYILFHIYMQFNHFYFKLLIATATSLM